MIRVLKFTRYVAYFTLALKILRSYYVARNVAELNTYRSPVFMSPDLTQHLDNLDKENFWL